MEKNFSSILGGFGIVFFGSFSMLAQQVAAPGLGEWSRAGQGCSGLVGCCVLQVSFGVSSLVFPASLLHLVWFGK